MYAEAGRTSYEPSQAAQAPVDSRLRSFDFRAHLERTAASQNTARHLKIGVQNWLTTEMMKYAVKKQPAVPEHYRPRAGQYRQIEAELHAPCSKDKYTMVLTTMPLFGRFDPNGGVDWVSEMAALERLPFPNYFLQPFHSIPGGWLNPLSALGNQAAFSALYRRAHRQGADGLRAEVAAFIPKSARVVYDFGASTGGQSAAILERLGPEAIVYAVEPAAPGVILGKRTIADTRLRWIHAFVEQTDLPENSADAVNMMFVAHECPDGVKRKLLKAAYDVLKPGGILVWTDPPADDLFLASRGFFEPYAREWQQWAPDRELHEAGFRDLETHHVVDPQYLWTRVAKK